MATDTRALAAQAIAGVLAGRSLNQVLPEAGARVAPRDRALLQQLCYGTLRQAPRLQGLLAQLLDKPLRDKDRDVQALLLCGLYQIEDTRIPDHAAVSATVAAVQALRKNWARGMANAVLRRFLREREALLAGLDEAALLAHPQWLLAAIRQQWPQQAEAIIAANNQQPPMTLRVNSGRLTREDCLRQLADAGIAALPGPLAPQAVRLDSPCDVGALPGFDEGALSVQDEGAQLAALLLDAQPGERVLDACAAPGGKSGHILELQPALGQLVAMDIDQRRLGRVQENLERLQLGAELVAGDATSPPTEIGDGFDRILVDAPCSASGVIRRHPDVKLLRRAGDIAGLQQQQLAILRGLWPLLKPGGVLLYVTCSILAGENAEVIAAFGDETPDAEAQPVTAGWGEPAGPGRQLLPSPDGTDGLFYARLKKREPG